MRPKHGYGIYQEVKKNGRKTPCAIETFTENNHDYVIDHEQTRWGITSSPYGYIQRKSN